MMGSSGRQFEGASHNRQIVIWSAAGSFGRIAPETGGVCWQDGDQRASPMHRADTLVCPYRGCLGTISDAPGRHTGLPLPERTEAVPG